MIDDAYKFEKAVDGAVICEIVASFYVYGARFRVVLTPNGLVLSAPLSAKDKIQWFDDAPVGLGELPNA